MLTSKIKGDEMRALSDRELYYLYNSLKQLDKSDIYLSNGLLSEAGVDLYYSRDEISYRVRSDNWKLEKGCLIE